MGKGSCFVVSESVGFARSAIGCVICLACAGPILLIVGIVLLVAPNHRAENVAKYNKAVDAWYGSNTTSAKDDPKFTPATIGDLYVVQHTTATVNTDTMYRSDPVPVQIVGNTDGVKSAFSTFFQGFHVFIDSKGFYKFHLKTNEVLTLQNATDFTSMSIPASHNGERDVKCTKEFCRHNCDGNDYSCSIGLVEDKCEGTWETTNSDCKLGQVCGKCTSKTYLSSICLVMKFSSRKGWTLDTDKQSCQYPFTMKQQQYNHNYPKGAVPVSLFSNADPYIQLQEIAEGNDFGLTKAQQKHLGIVVVVVGGLLTAAMIFVAVCVCSNSSRRERVTNYTQLARGNGGGGYNNIQTQQHAMQPPQQAYSTGYQQQPPQPGQHAPYQTV